MLAVLALAALGLALLGVGITVDDRTLRGAGVLSTFIGFICAGFLVIRWLIYRGIG